MKKRNRNNLLLSMAFTVVALVGARFNQPGIYTPFFALSVALQINVYRQANRD